MAGYGFSQTVGLMLAPGLRRHAAELLSYAYGKWQQDPRNTSPLATDTSPEVYERIMNDVHKEVLLYHEAGQLVAVFVLSLTPGDGQESLRKLSFLGVRPRERGFEALKRIFIRLAGWVEAQGEDLCITTDLEQATLNALLESAGFREIRDRNETYFILSRLLARQLITWHAVQGDFVVDEIINLDGKALRRDKKLYLLQTTSNDAYALYRRELAKRLERSLSPEALEGMRQALSHAGDGLLFILGYYDSIIERNPGSPQADTGARIFGSWDERAMAEYLDAEQGLVYLLPDGMEGIRDIARDASFRPGVFDFMTWCLKMLATVVICTGAPRQEVETVLQRPLHPSLPLRLQDMVERAFAPSVTIADGHPPRAGRHAFRFEPEYAEIRDRTLVIRKRHMVEQALALRGESRAPVIYCGGHEDEFRGVERLFQEARECRIPTLVLDFGSSLSRRVVETCMPEGPADTPCFGLLHVRDYYQLPVLLELLGLEPDPHWV